MASLVFGLPSPAHAEPLGRERYHDLVALCRDAEKPVFLAEDKSFLCFDPQRELLHDDDYYSKVDGLQPGGSFVVRSSGGSEIAALKLAAVLEQKKAVVVVYDYCVSACASFLLLAAQRAYVVRDSLVAWHDSTMGPDNDCHQIDWVRTPYGKQLQLNRTLCSDVVNSDANLDRYWQVRRMIGAFERRRVYADFPGDAPQSVYIRRELLRRYRGTGQYPDVLWMWHPRNYKSAIRTEITYEAYPETQEEVDILARRHFGPYATGSILYDP